jgi:hypothetical protein
MVGQPESMADPRFPAVQSDAPDIGMSGCAHFELADIVPDAAVARAAQDRRRLFLLSMVSSNIH